MKRELALQLLQTILPGLADESVAANLFRELQFLADYKYNKYEMYHPGRLFLENLYLWLQQFEESERNEAVNFVRQKLIFVSSLEFQQLAGGLHYDVIRRRQVEIAAAIGDYPIHRVQAICESAEFRKVARASLYVGMSDGARIDYIRRHNLEISNEQVLPYYETSRDKVRELLRELRTALGDEKAKFRCLFFIDDFCGSGRTLLREVVTSRLGKEARPPVIPQQWRARLKFNQQTKELEMLYAGEVTPSDHQALLSMGSGRPYVSAIDALSKKSKKRETVLKGGLFKAATRDLVKALHPEAAVFFCPLLATEHAMKRLKPILLKLPNQFSRLKVLPGAILDESVEITSVATAIGALCDRHYSEEFGDEHTGSVKFGFDNCGLPLVLHHNTPNNSIYLLWKRRRQDDFNPLFVRYERHGREGH